jgi:predicted TPR repeat methyltransferase
MYNQLSRMKSTKFKKNENDEVFDIVRHSFYMIYYSVLNSMFTGHQYLSDDDFKYYSVQYAKEIEQGNGDCLIRELMMASRYKEVTDIVSTPDICKLFHLIRLYPVDSNAKDVTTEPAL